jgi:hypothetical protein
VFERGPSGWTETAQLLADGPAQDLQGDTIVLGCDRSAPGSVVVHRRIGGIWTQVDVLTAPTPPSGPNLGTAVALEGDVLAVGAAWPGSFGPGRVEIFRLQGTTWSWVQTIVPAGSAVGDEFGSALSLSGGTLLVGAPYANAGAGRVHRFEDDGTAFVESEVLEALAPGNHFGVFVAVRGEDAILSSYPDVGFYRLGIEQASAYCPATPNSTGAPARLSTEGCDSVTCGQLALLASQLPRRALTLPFFGTVATSAPFADGTLCVSGTIRRLPAVRASPSGDLQVDLDFGAPPASAITAGSTWYFQVLYRDPGSGGAGLNLTHALSIGITP